jgi:hypothetical protein
MDYAELLHDLKGLISSEFKVRFAEQDQKLEGRFAAQDQKMDERFAAHDQKMDERFTAQDQKMDERFAAQDQKMDERFAAQDQKLNKEFLEIYKKFSNLEQHLEGKFSTLEQNLKTEIKEEFKETRLILRALEHSAEVNKADHDVMQNDITHMKGTIENMQNKLLTLELVTADNWKEISQLKIAK